MKALVVDDISDERKILRITLERQGFEVIEARDGREGLETAVLQIPDVIISDALMPRMDGFQFLREAKKDERLKAVPFIFYSAVYTGYKEAELALSLGAEAFIVRPKEPHEFWEELSKILEEHSRRITEKAPVTELLEEDKEFLRKYSHIVAMRLEETVTELRKALAELKISQEALLESEERYRNVVETALDAIITIDEESRILFVNPSAERIFGYSKAEMIGRQLTMLMPERLRDAHLASVKRHIETGERHMPWEAVEFPGLHKSGREIPLEISFCEVIENGKYRFTGIVRDITERKQAEETIKYQAYHDLLTGLPNRALFTDLLNHEIPQMQRTRSKLAVLFLDLDHFKNINDSLGHAAGDALIQQVAVRLKTGMREFDTLARIGGDTFTILLPLVNRPEDAKKIVEKVMGSFKQPFIIDAHELRVTASIGISIHPEDGEDAETLLRNADIAMYHAKDQGRNNYQFFNTALNIRTIERILLENRLRQAVERGELLVYYQPLMDIKTQEMVGAEALVRWRHPELGLLNPVQFIPLAEEIGLIIQIDQWVMRTACAQLKAWQETGYPLRYVTVNLSARQFQQPDLAEIISGVLEETGLSPESLGVEITETLAMRDTELTSRSLSKLDSMGIRFAIDDFGTGYSSLSYLKRLPIHKLKIDKSFIQYLISDPDYQAIVSAVVAMAHILKLRVLAEGVETEDELVFLRTRNCDEAQGYYFREPVPAWEFKELISLYG